MLQVIQLFLGNAFCGAKWMHRNSKSISSIFALTVNMFEQKGPATFEQASRVHVEPTNAQASPNRVDQGSHNFHDPSQHYVKHDVPANTHGPDLRSSPHSYPDHRPSGLSTICLACLLLDEICVKLSFALFFAC
jgi:hypothetical protein